VTPHPAPSLYDLEHGLPFLDRHVGPRDGELATQYFLRVLGESAEGRRVVFAEGLFEEPRALDMLGTHLLDGSVGAAFFGNDLRMHRDVLGDAARPYLDELAVEP